MLDEPNESPEALFRTGYADLIRVAHGLMGNRADAEDAVQNGYYKLLTAWPRISSLPSAQAQRAYLARIVINEALQILRDSYRKWECPPTDEAGLGVVQESLDERLQAKDDLRLVWEAISELPGMRRDVVTLFAAGYSYREIAKMLGVNTGTVRAHISYARRQLSRAIPRD
jgi:RNA polymerase sigma-70 factor, ECF subfamily